MIETLERVHERGRGRPLDLRPARLDPRSRDRRGRCSRAPARPRRPVGRPPPARVDPLRRGVHRPRAASTRSPSPARAARWWRSSASPSSAPSSGISSTAAKKLIGHALELRHRLPRLWAQVHAGAVPAWRARLVAEATIHTSPALTVEAAGLDRLPGRRRRRPDRHRAARPARRRDHQALRPRRTAILPPIRRTATCPSTPAT